MRVLCRAAASLLVPLLVACLSKQNAEVRVQDPRSADPAPSPSPPPPPPGEDFSAEARILFRVAACSDDGPVPANLDKAIVDDHCSKVLPRMKEYQKKYVEGAETFLAKLEPVDLPKTVVYPFGGGDLLSALTTYPEAQEITTLSLEHAGDPRRIHHLNKERLRTSLALMRKLIFGLLIYNDSTSANLMKLERCEIPGQVGFSLAALAIHGYEPVSLRYFQLEPNGSIHYLTREEIVAAEKRTAKKLNQIWVPPDFSASFSNMELTFRKRGTQEPVKIHRHIAANLADEQLAKDPSVLRHLEAKGKVAAMTKAASYLLWNGAFTQIRDYLLDHMVFMVSDSTGIPPQFAAKAGFIQETYGNFTNSFLAASRQYNDEFRKLWREQPRRELPFRYGYPDPSHANHMVITKLKEPAKS